MRFIAIAVLSALALECGAAESTFICRGKVKETAGKTSFKVGDPTTDTYVFDDATGTLTLFNGTQVKANVTASAISAKVSAARGNTLTISITRATGNYLSTLTKAEPAVKTTTEGKCTMLMGRVPQTRGSG